MRGGGVFFLLWGLRGQRVVRTGQELLQGSSAAGRPFGSYRISAEAIGFQTALGRGWEVGVATDGGVGCKAYRVRAGQEPVVGLWVLLQPLANSEISGGGGRRSVRFQ